MSRYVRSDLSSATLAASLAASSPHRASRFLSAALDGLTIALFASRHFAACSGVGGKE